MTNIQRISALLHAALEALHTGDEVSAKEYVEDALSYFD